MNDLHSALRDIFEGQAEWRRRKAIEYPDDQRNLVAADIFDELVKTVDDLDPALLEASEELFEDLPDYEVWQDMYDVGLLHDQEFLAVDLNLSARRFVSRVKAPGFAGGYLLILRFSWWAL